MKTIILKFTFLLFGATLIAQNTWTVDNRPGTTAQFTSVQAAHDAASPGDFIYIHPSPTSYVNLSIKKEIHLRGLGHNPLLGNGSRATFSTITISRNIPEATNASNSSISGLEIGQIVDQNEAAFSNIIIQNNLIGTLSFYQSYNYIIQGNLFNPTSPYSIYFNGTSHANNIISHNIFNTTVGTSATNAIINGLLATDIFSNNLVILSNNTAASYFFYSCNNPTVKNNLFVLAPVATTTAINTNASTITFENCSTFDYGGATLAALSGTNNLNNTNPQFVDIGTPANPLFAYTKNYKLNVGSPAIDAGTDGDDLGVYSQGFLFQMRGYPFDLPYPTTVNINNATVAAGNNLQVVFKANANAEN